MDFSFITKKSLVWNILASLVGSLLLILLFLLSLNWITHHGSTLTIPPVTGMPFEKAKAVLEEKGFDVEIQDSVYNDTAASLSVLRQFPAADALVKVNRTVYLTISRSVPPFIEMPIVEGLSYRNAVLVLRQYGLKLRDTLYRSDFAKNAVLEQLFQGQRIKPGTKINMGSAITLVLGSGVGSDQLPVPDLVGMRYAEARVLIESSGLILDVVVADAEVRDSASAFVYRQQPERYTPDGMINRIRPGQSMDLFLSVNPPVKDPDPSTNPRND